MTVIQGSNFTHDPQNYNLSTTYNNRNIMNHLQDYTELYPLNKSGTVTLIKNDDTGQLFVKKILEIYDLYVYEYLASKRPKGIPIIHSFELTQEGLLVIEEYINGQTLKTALAERGPADPNRAIRLITRICEILAPLHRNNPPIVHRDIKPSNILITDTEEIYLLDFNAATKYSKDKDQDTVLIGTTGYAAPEQYGFKASDPRADVFALGRVSQELLIGEKVSPENYKGPFPDIIKKCLELDPDKRYRDAGDLASAFWESKAAAEKQATSTQRSGITADKATPFEKRSPDGFFDGAKKGLWKWFIMVPLMVVLLFGVWNSQMTNGIKSLPTDIIIVLYCFTQASLIINFGRIHSRLPITDSPRILIRILGIFVYSLTLFFVVALLLKLVEY